MTTPPSEVLCHSRPGLGMVNICTKFEVSTSTHYEDRKGDTKCIKWGDLG